MQAVAPVPMRTRPGAPPRWPAMSSSAAETVSEIRLAWSRSSEPAAVGVAPAAAQTPDPGHRVYSPLTGTDTILVDAQGTTLHTWPSANAAGNTVYVQDDGVLLRAIKTGVVKIQKGDRVVTFPLVRAMRGRNRGFTKAQR